MPPIDRSLLLSALGSLVLGGLITAGGVSVARSDAPIEQVASPAAPAATAAAAAPKDSGMTCKGAKTCTLYFAPKSADTLAPFGLDVKLVEAEKTKAKFTVGGKNYTAEKGKPAKVDGATVKFVGVTKSEVALQFTKG